MGRQMCESCGMPLKGTEGGTNADGTMSDRYCRHCYADGAFTVPDASAADMREMSIKGMSESGWPRWLATLMTMRTHKLPRWQKSDTSAP